MPGKIVTLTNLDICRIEVLGEGRAVSVSAALVLALDRVLRRCADLSIGLEIEPVEDDESRRTGWEARLDMGVEASSEITPTPWAALISLAEELER